jgi:hypothetical protein
MEFYVPEKITVVLNTSGSALLLGIPSLAGGSIMLHPRKGTAFVDIEDVCDPKMIRAHRQKLEMLTARGKIKWFPKGSRPTAPAKTSANAPPNIYDTKINKLIEKEKKEDERTKTSESRRAEPSEEEPAKDPNWSGQDWPGTRAVDPDQGEVEVGGTVDIEKLLDLAVEHKLVDNTVGYYKFKGQLLGRGKEKACESLEKDAKLRAEIQATLESAA